VKYVVLKRFKDRFSKMKIFDVGDEHTPPNKERAEQLVKLGYIKPAAEQEKQKSMGAK